MVTTAWTCRFAEENWGASLASQLGCALGGPPGGARAGGSDCAGRGPGAWSVRASWALPRELGRRGPGGERGAARSGHGGGGERGWGARAADAGARAGGGESAARRAAAPSDPPLWVSGTPFAYRWATLRCATSAEYTSSTMESSRQTFLGEYSGRGLAAHRDAVARGLLRVRPRFPRGGFSPSVRFCADEVEAEDRTAWDSELRCAGGRGRSVPPPGCVGSRGQAGHFTRLCLWLWHHHVEK